MHETGPESAQLAESVELAELSAPVRAWFERRFGTPTEPQRRGWPAIARGEDTLIAAPTGSGKTLAAFLIVIDRLVRRALEGRLEDRLEALYVSPLRALSHDIAKNLEGPLAEIREEAARQGYRLPEIRAAVRTGDTPQSERQAMLRRPPHILVTTPESLYLLLTAQKSRPMLAEARTLIVDEIHALARDKRGSHLALSLARLDRVAHERPRRIGLSATQRPIELIARYLVGPEASGSERRRACTIVDLGHQRDLDLAVAVPKIDDLGAVATHEQWSDLLDGVAEQVREHRTTLVFTNTRRLAERLAHLLGERLGDDVVAAHHGSLSRERRLRVEARLRAGDLRALVATASLELGIDIGTVDLVCQVGSPRGIATFLQRVGRSGHALGLTPKGRLLPTSRDELGECAALLRAVRAERLDAIQLPSAPLDVLAQQIVASCAAEEWDEDELFALCRSAVGYEALAPDDYEAVLELLARGIETPKGRRAAYLHRDRLQKRLRGRRGARIAALTSGGAIPELGDYRVVLDPDETLIGTVNEDWAIESMAGDVFLLGTHSWRIRRVESGVVRVQDAQGAPPTIPFWLGEAPARTRELSEEVSRLREDLAAALAQGPPAARALLVDECGLDEEGARQLADYVRVQLESAGRLPTCRELVAERFFDEAGGMQLVVHSPYGARINRGFGLALRKRFCGSFNQELQAAATDDAIVLSLGSPQTFPLETLPRFLHADTVGDVLTQALLDSPLFTARWRWNANRSLAVLRFRGGKRVPFPLQRMQADDLLAAVFPDLAACQENVTFPLDVPDHPLVGQTLDDCLHEATDLEGIRALLRDIHSGAVRFHVMDTVEPTPFAHEILNAKPYAFLDDAPLEERRTRAVSLRHVLPEEASDLARLEPEAIARVRDEARPVVRDADELYELLLDVVALAPDDPAARLGDELVAAGRAARVSLVAGGALERLFALERRAEIRALYPEGQVAHAPELPSHLTLPDVTPEQALDQAVRGHLALVGPTTAQGLAARLGLAAERLEAPLARLEGRGIAVRGSFDPELPGEQFCDRSLLARIHRYTLVRLRQEIEPVSAQDFLRFLVRWQRVAPDCHAFGESGALQVIEQLAGFEAPAVSWEAELLPARIGGYRPEQLDALCLGGAVVWARLSPQAGAQQPTRVTPIAFVARAELDPLLHAAREVEKTDVAEALSEGAQSVLALLRRRGALFARELATAGLGTEQALEDALRELVACGRISCDGFAPLRRLVGRRTRRARRLTVRTRAALPGSVPVAEGRWSELAPEGEPPDPDVRAELTAQRLLRRYGVVFRDLLAREWVPEGWRHVHRALRRLEARGLVRGGRFVSGFMGEQFALPEAIPELRKERRRERDGGELRISAADPLNLAGILTPGPRVAASHARWLVLCDGLPVAALDRGRRVSLEGSVYSNSQVTRA